MSKLGHDTVHRACSEALHVIVTAAAPSCLTHTKHIVESCVCVARRMIWSFARDRGLPGNTIWKRVNRLTGTPMNAIAFAVVVAFLLGLPLIHSTVAFTAVVSISTIGLYISYAIPIFCRLTIGRRGFQPGPFNLGLLSQPIGWTAVIWVLFITVGVSSMRTLASRFLSGSMLLCPAWSGKSTPSEGAFLPCLTLPQLSSPSRAVLASGCKRSECTQVACLSEAWPISPCAGHLCAANILPSFQQHAQLRPSCGGHRAAGLHHMVDTAAHWCTRQVQGSSRHGSGACGAPDR